MARRRAAWLLGLDADVIVLPGFAVAAVAPLAAKLAALQLQVHGLAAQVAALPNLPQIQAAINAALVTHNALAGRLRHSRRS